jgi:branched-chain amino acid transport system ATP-binding protein
MTMHKINGEVKVPSPVHSAQPQTTPVRAKSATTPHLALSDICVRFGGVLAVNGVSLTVGRQEIVGLIGPNGAGKTTLFDVISGVQPATRGRIEFDGRVITRLGPTRRSRLGIRRTFQRSQPFGWLSVEDNVLVALESGGGLLGDLLGRTSAQERQRRDRVREVLAQFQLEKVRDEAAGRLPIGVIRMVELARAVVGRPSLLLLDEPTSGLDRRETDLLGEAMQRTAADDKCTVLLVEHDVPFVMSNCQRVVALHLGSLLADGSPQEVQKNEQVREAYLGQHTA